jgi:ATP-binding cassette, subfamily B, bacterial
VMRWAGLLVLLEVARMTSIHFGALTWTRVWVQMQTLLRANLLAAQVASGGPEAGQPVGSAGEALTHFRDDVEDVAQFVDGLVDVSAGLAFTMLAGVVLGVTERRRGSGARAATGDGGHRDQAPRHPHQGVPAGRSGGHGIGHRPRRRRDGGATTVKVNDATDALLARLRHLVDERRVTAVRDRVLDEGVQAFSRGAADVGLGAVLLVAAGGLASGSSAWATSRSSPPTSVGSASCRG